MLFKYKKEIVRELSEQLGFTIKDTELFLNALIENMQNNLREGNSVVLRGLGSFKVVDTKARIGRNPQTGKEIKIKASKKIKFSVAKELKDCILNKKK